MILLIFFSYKVIWKKIDSNLVISENETMRVDTTNIEVKKSTNGLFVSPSVYRSDTTLIKLIKFDPIISNFLLVVSPFGIID